MLTSSIARAPASPEQRVPVYPSYRVPFAERVRREASIAAAAVGPISAPDVAEEIIANGRADIVALGRILLSDPYWLLHAANALEAKTVPSPLQYERTSIF
jgi:2,4-dienoyl-CoA reductase-like NADH-dependent reductase (Old Yellow Enzyme family)